MKKLYNWDAEKGIATCEIIVNNQIFHGEAHCHAEDRDYGNELTGCMIAETRSVIKYLAYVRHERTIALKAFKHLYKCLSTSKHFNKKSYEAKMLYRQIKIYQAEIDELKLQINSLKDNLKEYIDFKDSLYRKFRAKKTAKGEVDEIQ